MVLTEGDLHEERISFVPEDDIVGGRVHVMYDRLTHDDYAGALMVAESILRGEPDHHDALQCSNMCQIELRKLYVARIGNLERIPQLSVESAELSQRVYDEQAAQLLHFVDGLSRIGTVVDASGLPPVEALRILSELYLRHVIEFEDE